VLGNCKYPIKKAHHLLVWAFTCQIISLISLTIESMCIGRMSFCVDLVAVSLLLKEGLFGILPEMLLAQMLSSLGLLHTYLSMANVYPLISPTIRMTTCLRQSWTSYMRFIRNIRALESKHWMSHSG
jgi:hypothetical protein